MSRHDPEITLQQIVELSRRAQEFCTENTLSEIVDDWRKCAAFERVMEVLGEAVKRLPADLVARHPEVNWRGIAGMRDRVSHGYDAIDHDLLWQAVEKGVPGLLIAVEKMIKELQDGKSK